MNSPSVAAQIESATETIYTTLEKTVRVKVKVTIPRGTRMQPVSGMWYIYAGRHGSTDEWINIPIAAQRGLVTVEETCIGEA